MTDVPRLGSAVPFFARQRELETLRATLARATAVEAGAVLIGGEAGVGKSRLLRELTDEAAAAGTLVLTGRCVDLGEAGLPYLAFAEALGGLRGADLDAARRRPALGRILPLVGTPERAGGVPVAARVTPGATPEQDIGQLQLFEAVFALLAELSGERTVVLALEDLHWADSSTRNLFSLLATRLRDARILLLGTYRTDELHRGHPLRPLLAELVRLPVVDRLDLAPLDTADVRGLIDALGDLPDDVALRLAERAEGNPFFAEELVAAAEGGADVRRELPTALADVLLSRIERLGEATQHLLRLMAVAGGRIDHDLLRAVSAGEPAELDLPLREAVAHHVLHTDDTGHYRFRHALLREAVYADLLPGERVRLHARYAERIAAAPPHRGSTAALAHHSRASNDLVTALSASVAAAGEAADLGAPPTALAHAEQALQLWDAVPAARRPDGVLLADLVREAAYLAATSGEVERSISYARLAIREADALGDTASSVRARRRLMDSLSGVDGSDAEVSEVAEQAWHLVADSPPGVLRAWVLAKRASIQRSTGDPAARESAELAIAESGALDGAGAAGAKADALTTLALIDDEVGAMDAARAHLLDAVATARAAGQAGTELRALCYLALHHHDHGRLIEGRTVCVEALDAAAEHGLSWSIFAVELRVLLIVLATALGEWDLAARQATAGGGPESNMVLARIAAAGTMVTLARGEFDATQTRLAELRAHWHRDAQIPLYAGCAEIELELWRGRELDAVSHADGLVDWVTESADPLRVSTIRIGALAMRAYLAAARATGHAGHRASAEAIHDRIEHVAATAQARTGTPGPEALAWLSLARAQRTGEPAAWAEAVTAFGYGDVYRQATARLDHAEALLATGDRTGCARDLRETHRVARELGAAPLAGAAQALAARVGVDLATGAAPPADDLLTPRERSVLELVAAGRTNREIGAELFISEKTVSVHVSRAMGKLGVGRRAEAVAVAYDRGLLTRGPH